MNETYIYIYIYIFLKNKMFYKILKKKNKIKK